MKSVSGCHPGEDPQQYEAERPKDLRVGMRAVQGDFSAVRNDGIVENAGGNIRLAKGGYRELIEKDEK